MTDKEMLDWVEKNVFKIRLQLNDTYLVDYYEGDGTHKEAQGVSLRDCIQKANPVTHKSHVEFAEQLCNAQTEKLFDYNNYQLKAVQTGGVTCKGCDFYHENCRPVNDVLESLHGHRCGPDWHIMFVNQKDKDEHYQD